MAGYSGTPLWKKLGVKPGSRLALVDVPDGFQVPDLPGDVTPEHGGPGPFDVQLAFARDAADVDRHLAALGPTLDPAGGLWIAWPKKASGVPTDVTEDGVRERGLAAGLVDNKVCAVDEVWSALRLVVRVADRPQRAPPPPLAEDVREALADAGALEKFLAMSPSHEKEHIQLGEGTGGAAPPAIEFVEEAKRPDTRARRITATVEALRS